MKREKTVKRWDARGWGKDEKEGGGGREEEAWEEEIWPRLYKVPYLYTYIRVFPIKSSVKYFTVTDVITLF